MWTLQLFPATPRLAPIYNPVTHMVPPPFPLLLVVPAVAFDLLVSRFNGRSDWLLAPLLGLTFVAVMLVAHWWWAEFLLTPSARNAFFAADQWDYYIEPGDWRYQFWTEERGFLTMARGLGIAALTAAVSARVGLWIGRGMARVQR
jgi:hypothetical protein